MKKILLFLIFTFPYVSVAQQREVQTGVYSWKKPEHKIQQHLFSSTLFEGVAHHMEYLQMSANALLQSSRMALQVPDNEEHLLLIKGGTLDIGIKDSAWSLEGGSIALLMPGEKYTIQNSKKDSCTYYVVKYRSKSPADLRRGKTSGGSLIQDWNNITFKPHDRGGSRNYFERPTAMCKRFEMHVTTLKEGLISHAPHKHSSEEIILVIENKTEMEIGGKVFQGETGDMYYIGSNVMHGIRNNGKGLCSYFAFQFE